MKRSMRTLALGGAGVTATTLFALGISSPGQAATPPSAGLTAAVQDRTTGAYLRLSLDPTAASYGSLLLSMPGTGLVWTDKPVAVSRKSDRVTQLRYDGAGYVNAAAKLDTEFGVVVQPAGEVRDAKVRVVGQVDPSRHTGSVEFWIDGVHYHFGSASDLPDAAPAADTALAAIGGGDWGRVYDAADSSLRNGMTKEEFVTAVTGALPGTITGATRSGPAAYRTTDAGTSVADIPVTMTVLVGGASQTQKGTLSLVFDDGAWRFFTVS